MGGGQLGDFTAAQEQSSPGTAARWARAMLWNWWAGKILALRGATTPSPADEAFVIRRAGWARSHRLGRLRLATLGELATAAMMLVVGSSVLAAMLDRDVARGFFELAYGIFCTALPLIPAVVGVIVVMRFLPGRVLLPLWLSEAFSLSAPHAGMALDLWMAGLTGRDVAMGLWQEARRRGEPWLVAQGLIVVPAAAVMLVPLVGGGWGPALALGVPILLLAVYTAGQWALLMSALHGLTTIDMVVGRRLEGWRGGDRVGIVNTALWVPMMIVIVGLMSVGGYMVAYALSQWIEMLLRQFATTAGLAYILHLPLAVLLMAVVLHLAQRSIHVEAALRVRLLTAEADLPFDLMIAARVLDDPEFARWARWRHETPYIPLYAPVGAMETTRPGAVPPPTAGWEG
jgi:hypothetical protein